MGQGARPTHLKQVMGRVRGRKLLWWSKMREHHEHQITQLLDHHNKRSHYKIIAIKHDTLTQQNAEHKKRANAKLFFFQFATGGFQSLRFFLRPTVPHKKHLITISFVDEPSTIEVVIVVSTFVCFRCSQ